MTYKCKIEVNDQFDMMRRTGGGAYLRTLCLLELLGQLLESCGRLTLRHL
jgi:hypothetical protein